MGDRKNPNRPLDEQAQQTASSSETEKQPTRLTNRQQHVYPSEEEVAERVRIQREIASWKPPKHLMRMVVRKKVGGAISSVVTSGISSLVNRSKSAEGEATTSGAQGSSGTDADESSEEKQNSDGQQDAETDGWVTIPEQ
ncbi:hypothetical protein ACRALDRAFT_1070489 [Sodiomyces alcalophilus JCM 7366]|uniref:uncharacterized protein n=1 Tax=Sodiomyces alcalophilus JCM 7366 TaxID=591952 RepID=UPI0039B3C93F